MNQYQKKGKDRSRGSSLVALLVGILFFAGGIWAAYALVGKELLLWHESRSWVPVEATLQRVDLKRIRSKQSYTYKVEAAYSYKWQEREYSGKQVGLSTEADNIGSWQEDTYQRLRQLQQKKQHATAFVNPTEPESALLDRSLRPGFLLLRIGFVGVFIVIGGFLLVVPFLPSPQEKVGDSKTVSLSRWRDRTARSSHRGQILLGSVLGLASIGMSIPALLALPQELSQGNYALLLVLLFPLGGVAFLLRTFSLLREQVKFGEMPLHLDPFPGTFEKGVGGWVELPVPHHSLEHVEATLSCVACPLHNKRERSIHRTIWEQTVNAHRQLSSKGVRIYCSFSPDSSLPQSEVPIRPYHYWQVSLTCVIEGKRMTRVYNVPVLREQSSN